jgi:ATP-dependent DNA ligase
MAVPLGARHGLLQSLLLAKLSEPIRESPDLQASLADLAQSVKAPGLEGLVDKHRESRYEPDTSEVALGRTGA